MTITTKAAQSQIKDGVPNSFEHTSFQSQRYLSISQKSCLFNILIVTRSYAALQAADLDWIVGPGYDLGGYILGKNHENQPGTMKNQPRTMKNHENQPGTMKMMKTDLEL